MRRELLNSASWPASDDALVDVLLGFANGAEVVMLSKPPERPATTEEKRAHMPAPVELRSRFAELLELAVEDPNRLREEFFPLGAELIDSLKVKPVMVFGTHGHSLDYFRELPDLRTALTYAVMLLLDAHKSYGAALCRCRLPSCGRFYLARRKKKGGPANRVYCRPQHRAEHHNSAARKAAKPPARHK